MTSVKKIPTPPLQLAQLPQHYVTVMSTPETRVHFVPPSLHFVLLFLSFFFVFFFFLVPFRVFGFSSSYERSRIKLFNRSNQAYAPFLRRIIRLNNPKFLESLSFSWMCPNESGSKCTQGRCWDTLFFPLHFSFPCYNK